MLLLCLAVAASTGLKAASHTRVRLALAEEVAAPGSTVMAGVVLEMDAGWHTYWVNPGDSGGPTEIAWQLPAGITAGAIRWPVPEKHTLEGLTTYVHHERATLLVPLTLDSSLKEGLVEVRAMVSWLECSDLCVPGAAEVAATLVVGSETRAAADIAWLDEARARMPRQESLPGVAASWADAGLEGVRTLRIEWPGASLAPDADFLPLSAKDYEVEAETQHVAAEGLVRLEKKVRRVRGEWPTAVSGVLVVSRATTLVAYEVVLRPPAGAADASREGERALRGAATRGATSSLWWMLLLAFVGGVILNAMPCVLPVIALKVLGFVRQAKESPATVRQHGLLYGLGVLMSFAVLAGVVIGVQAAGRVANWGMQFQSAGFLLAMTTLVTLVALNLFGVFEVSLSGRALGAAATWAGREGAAGAFFNGVLATALATPCTAPFLGTAVGFALTQSSAPVILLLFLTIGFGLAAPYVAICFVPGLSRLLPRPGVWMERLKVAMGFPMLGAAAWLLSVLARHYGSAGVLWVGVFLVGVALAAWLWGQMGQRAESGRWRWAVLSLLVVLAVYGWALEGQLRWRESRTAGATSPAAAGSLIAWEPWSREAVERARREGRVVLVDFTADWCLTCQANKKTSLEIPSVADQLRALGAVALLGDYTLKDPAITEELRRFERGGVPLVLVYPRQSDRPPVVLPQLLTPGIVREALEDAAR